MASIEPLENRRLLSANLVPAFTGRLPTTIAPSGVTHLHVKVVNSAAAAVTETMTLRVYASADRVLDGSDVLLGTVQQNVRFKPRAGAQVAVNLPTPTNLPDGNYFLLAQADGSSPVAVTKKQVAFQNPFSDVAVQFGQLPSQPIEIDGPSAGTRSVCATLTNTGNIAVRGKVNLNFYLSADATLDSADPLLATRLNQSIALKPHAGRAVSFRVAIPPGTAVGAYFLFASLTPVSGFTDANPADNIAVSSRRVAVVTQLPHPTTIEHRDDYYDNGTYIYYGVGDYSADTGADYYSTDYTDDGSSDDSGNDSGDNSGDSASSPAPDAGSSDSSDSTDGSDNSSCSDSWSSGDYVSSGGDF